MTPALLAQIVRDAHRRIAERRLGLDGAFRQRLAAILRTDGWLA